MNIPERFKNILSIDQKTEGIVMSTVADYSNILKENNLYFFEEYTNHGIDHIESVLRSAEKIIADETFENILNESLPIGIFILSVVLHDIGMHLTPEGLRFLIEGKNDSIRIKSLDNKTWKELWEDFLDDARRFGDIDKLNIIGNVDWQFRVPDLDHKDKLTGEDKKLIGEFIRKHHPRIAHEIALNGFPTSNLPIPFANDLEKDLSNICGLLARSHGINIRDTFEFLTLKFQDTWTKPYNIDLLFLMVVLRIADYFQIEASRTPTIIVKLKTFNSPISQQEHFKHLDVKYGAPSPKIPKL
ncbi:HD domain-containing protein [Flavobacterium sp. 3HN19-14]|uniref:HD domain-containing protein n=1 Tax=Flavobacterium sp. 3HN19-14 TaxID=3448133 RepID=UPI003EE14A94